MNYIDYLTTTMGNALNNAQTRWNAAIAAIRAGTYTANDFVSDSLNTWLDTASPWWAVYSSAVDAPVPVVGFNITAGTTLTQTATTSILPPLGTPPPVHCTDVQRIGGTQKVTGDTDATATLSECVLTVQLQNLGSLPAGEYQGGVYLAGTVNRLVAVVLLVIS